MQTLDDPTFHDLAALMQEQVGIAFTASKKSLVSSRLSSRLQRLGLGSFRDYLALLREPGEELQTAIDLLTTNETYFFREPAHFERIEAELSAHRPARVRAWSAAASFGDEAYSLAMLLADLHVQGRIGGDWSILGTDISDRVLRTASQGVYPAERLHQVAPERLRRHCLRGEGEADGLVQIREALQSHVQFGQLNLCAPLDVPLPGAPFDIVLLRNVLIYFDPPTKRAVVDRVLTQLRPGGLFFIGTAEGRVSCDTPLEVLAPGAFRKAGAAP